MALNPYPTVAEAWATAADLRGLALRVARTTTPCRPPSSSACPTGSPPTCPTPMPRATGTTGAASRRRGGSGPIQDVSPAGLDFEANVIGVNDRTHIFKGYAAWELPFGQGRRWMDQGGFLDAVFGGWQVSFIFRYQTGLPLRITSNNWYQAWGYPIYVNADPNGDYCTHVQRQLRRVQPHGRRQPVLQRGKLLQPRLRRVRPGPGPLRAATRLRVLRRGPGLPEELDLRRPLPPPGAVRAAQPVQPPLLLEPRDQHRQPRTSAT